MRATIAAMRIHLEDEILEFLDRQPALTVVPGRGGTGKTLMLDSMYGALWDRGDLRYIHKERMDLGSGDSLPEGTVLLDCPESGMDPHSVTELAKVIARSVEEGATKAVVVTQSAVLLHSLSNVILAHLAGEGDASLRASDVAVWEATGVSGKFIFLNQVPVGDHDGINEDFFASHSMDMVNETARLLEAVHNRQD